VNLDVGVAYESDLEKVIEVVNTVGRDLASDPAWKEKIIKAPEFVRVNEFADSSINVKILGDVKPLEQWAVTGEFRKRLKLAFDKEKIEIPFPQRVIHKK
jgi:small conductance mechanosensitive channel